MSVGDVSAALSAIRQRLADAAQQTHAVVDTVTARRDGLARLFHGSSNPRVAAILGRLDAAAQRLRAAGVDVTAGDAAIGAYVAAITAGSSASPAAPAGTASAPPGVLAGAQYDAAKAAEIQPHVGRGVAAGRLYDTKGQPLTPLAGPGEAGAARGIGEPLRLMRFVNHVESNAASHMREHHIRRAVLYLNMAPCKGPDGCAANLEAVLPAGYQLVVHQVRSNGGTRVYFYNGNGQGLSDERD